MTRTRFTVSALLSLALSFAADEARAQGDDSPYLGPPRPPEEEAPPPLEAGTPPTPAPAPAPASEPAPEEPPSTRFGAAGVMVITNAIGMGASTSRYAASDAEYDSVWFYPGFDYFFVPHLSLGLDVSLSYSRSTGYGADSSLIRETATTVGAGPRFGVDIPLGRLLSFYPRLTLAIESEHHERRLVSGKSSASSSNPFGTPSTTQTGPTVLLFTPLLLHPVPHLFIGAGPSVFHEFGRAQGGPDIGGERTSIGGRFVVGAWWGGQPDGAAREAPPASAVRERRFGDEQQLVFTGEAGASIYATMYEGSTASTTAVRFSPGFDYFVSSQLSLGLGVSAQYATQVGLQASGERVTYESSSLAVEPRIGLNIPLSAGLSLYPRAYLSGGFRNTSERTGAEENVHHVSIVAVALYVPVLFHFAPHAFLGFGPSVSHDLVKKEADYTVATENLATTLGAGVIVGGWL